MHQNKKKGAQAEDPKHRKLERQKEKSIRLDDLIPNQNVRGGRRFFGATDPNNQPKTRRNSMPQKKETTRTTKKKTGVKPQDLEPKKDAKGGGISSNHAPQPSPKAARGNG